MTLPLAADDTVERAFEQAAADPARLDDLLDALQRGRLWVPLPDDGTPVTDGSAVALPTVRYLGQEAVPAYTCAARLPPDARRHLVVAAADLARRLPAGLGIALNPGAPRSIMVPADSVGDLGAGHPAGGGPVTVGPPPAVPAALLAAIGAGLGPVPAAREAATAWLTVGGAGGGSGLVISVRLDDPADPAARQAVLAAVQAAVAAQPGGEVRWPVDLTFPGEGEPDVIDRWVAAASDPFWRRAARRLSPA
jgi:hypothetical protein